LIARLFPNARILFAERDPRDVVFSCFRRAFQINTGMYQFTSLESAARFYDLTLTAAREYLRVFPLEVRPARYESLVADIEGESRALCGFLGVDWDAEMLRFADRARGRSIRTPSAPQVRRGLYTTGVDQWRRYVDHLAPVLPVLDRWAATLGYVSQFLRVVPRVPALDIVAEAAQGMFPEAALEAARALLLRLNIPARLHALPPATFSGGEQQRINLARGFIGRHPILLLDEPTASLDAANAEIVIAMIAEAKASGVAIVGIFHDANVRDRVADRVFQVLPLQDAA